MIRKISPSVLISKKQKGEKIIMLTAYDYNMAQILDETEIDIILVGDSLGMVFQGNSNTLTVELNHMIYHTEAVSKGCKYSMVVSDMPFGTFQLSPEETYKNAVKLIKAGANAVKIEGGSEMANTIEFLVSRGIPVMGHIGLQPQSINVYGGYKVQGKSKNQVEKLVNDAMALQNAGAFSIVLETITENTAKQITEKLSIPTIGIGSGRYCDGQVLVINDLLGLTKDIKPRFVKRYLELAEEIKKAVFQFKEDVQKGIFPSEENIYR